MASCRHVTRQKTKLRRIWTENWSKIRCLFNTAGTTGAHAVIFRKFWSAALNGAILNFVCQTNSEFYPNAWKHVSAGEELDLAEKHKCSTVNIIDFSVCVFMFLFTLCGSDLRWCYRKISGESAFAHFVIRKRHYHYHKCILNGRLDTLSIYVKSKIQQPLSPPHNRTHNHQSLRQLRQDERISTAYQPANRIRVNISVRFGSHVSCWRNRSVVLYNTI